MSIRPTGSSERAYVGEVVRLPDSLLNIAGPFGTRYSCRNFKNLVIPAWFRWTPSENIDLISGGLSITQSGMFSLMSSCSRSINDLGIFPPVKGNTKYKQALGNTFTHTSRRAKRYLSLSPTICWFLWRKSLVPMHTDTLCMLLYDAPCCRSAWTPAGIHKPPLDSTQELRFSGSSCLPFSLCPLLFILT